MAKKPAAKTPPAPTYPVNPALEAAVIAHAEEDTPRLVYADWLDENGDPDRAAYIRNEVALWDKNPADPDYQDLIEKRLELRVQTGPSRLEQKLPAAVGFHDSSLGGRDDEHVAFHRGFPYFAQEPYVGGRGVGAREAIAFREALPQLFATTTIRGLAFDAAMSAHLETVLATPAAKQVSALSLSHHGTSCLSFIKELVPSLAAANLQWLSLSGIDTDDGTLAKAIFPRLRRLHVYWWGASDEQTRAIASIDWFGGLHSARIGTGGQRRAVFAGLGQAPNLHTLESYSFPRSGLKALTSGYRALARLFIKTDLRGSGAQTLAHARFPALADLELQGGLRNDDVLELCQSSLFDHLTRLSLDSNEIGEKGVKAIAATPSALSLRSLCIGDNPLGKSALACIAKPGAFPNLTTLDLHSSTKRKATASEVTHFIHNLAIPGLRHLNLDTWPVDDSGAVALAANAAFENLRWLSIGYSQIGKRGLRALAESPHLRNVVYLYLSSNPCEKFADVLCDSTFLPNLAECWITQYGDPVRERLMNARPNVRWL
jgi:uncharacterized protein (TIGR02996 family)